jgi:hypothetical protein
LLVTDRHGGGPFESRLRLGLLLLPILCLLANAYTRLKVLRRQIDTLALDRSKSTAPGCHASRYHK